MKQNMKTLKNSKLNVYLAKLENRASHELLADALEVLGIEADVQECYLSETGKPMHPNFWFSVSHTNDLCAIAVAPYPVGIDLECSTTRNVRENVLARIRHKNEDEEDTLLLWTLKEAAFKYEGREKQFYPMNIDTTAYSHKSIRFMKEEQEYILSVVADSVEGICLHER